MVNFFTEIPSSLVPWIQEQKIFWVATAPLSPSGHINLSPKGYEGTFNILDEKTVWYEDLTGSGMNLVGVFWFLSLPLLILFCQALKRSRI